MKHKRKFISLKGMAEAKLDEAMLNAKIKRGKYPVGSYVSFIPCGCGADHVIPTVIRPIKPIKPIKTNSKQDKPPVYPSWITEKEFRSQMGWRE